MALVDLLVMLARSLRRPTEKPPDAVILDKRLDAVERRLREREAKARRERLDAQAGYGRSR